MNDQIKLLVAGATIALAGVVAGGTIVGWTLQMESAVFLLVYHYNMALLCFWAQLEALVSLKQALQC